MANVLVISDLFPDDLTSGRHLRVSHLCREIARNFSCFFIAMSDDRAIVDEDSMPPFIGKRQLSDPLLSARSRLRHLRLSNSHYVERSWPDHFSATTNYIKQCAEEWNIDAVVNFAPLLGEYSLTLDLPCILDITDCDTLTIERVLANRGDLIPYAARMKNRLQLYRQRHREKRLVREHAAITTIGRPDQKRLLEISGVTADRISIVPNGVSSDAMTRFRPDDSGNRSVVFWGNLDFPPNWTAVESFYHDVFLPFLAEKDVEWHVVGRGASDKLVEIARHPNVHLEGFVEDLYDFISDKGVMINPMIEGSGLKNKVIEAFAVGLPVVSTPLGVEAIEGDAGRHFLVASEPSKFAENVEQLLSDEVSRRAIRTEARRLVEEKYSWSRVGEMFSEKLSEVASL